MLCVTGLIVYWVDGSTKTFQCQTSLASFGSVSSSPDSVQIGRRR